MKRLLSLFGLLALNVVTTHAIVVPLTIQETLYPGSVAGVARVSEPVSVGVPLPDDPIKGVSDVNQLTLTGAAVGQFRVLGRWPSGRIKWVLVDTLLSVAAGQSATGVSLTDAGSGNFGGSNLAVDNGSTITVNTGGAIFTIKKANFNVIDQAIVGGKTVVASGSSKGLVLTGPAPGQSTCPPCTNIYTSANDPNSTAVIEENGPVKTVIVAKGSHVDANGNPYMRFTIRMYFYLGKSYVKVNSVLRNADYGTSNTLATSYKGHQGYDLQISPNLASTPSFTIANHTALPSTGTLAASDSAYLYQGEAQQMKWQDWCGSGCVPYTTDTGYNIQKNGTTLMSGTDTQYPQGWADISDASGTGVEIGVYQLAAYWPKSLEFNAGGSDVRIGIWPRENSKAYYQAWPQWSIHDLYLNFHATALSAPANEFLKFQHYLVGRASIADYNAASVFPYPLVDPTVEDSFYSSVAASANPSTIPASAACCIQDFGTTQNVAWPLSIFRFYAWHATGGANQTEFRWSYLLNFLSRGMTGRFLEAAHFYRFQAESAWPHSDGFNWFDHTGEIDGFGMPTATSLNSTSATLNSANWLDQEHGHWYGMPDYYFMTGDETIHEALLQGPYNYFLTTNSYQNGAAGGLYNTRSIGVNLLGASRYSQFLAATGDTTDAAKVLNLGINDYNVQVKPDLCVSGYPSGCTVGPADGGPWNTQGVSRARGIPWGAAGTSGSWCNVSHAYRVNSSFQPAILMQGLMEFRNTAGTSWPDYWNSLDLADGIASWNLSENYVDDGSGRWDINGFRFGLAMDVPNSCTGPGESPEPDFQPVLTETTAMTFLAKYVAHGDTSWANKFKINIQKDMAALGISTSDFGSYQLSSIINILSNPSSGVLSAVPITAFVDNGGGSYTVSWVVPSGAQNYRIKWGAKKIVDWVGFDPTNNVFTGDPVNTMPWFAANTVSSVPSSGAAGTTQSLTISTGTTGLLAANFSIKATVAGGGTSGVATNLVMVSGTNQSATVGTPLANPLVVEALDGNGNPVSGVIVTFAVTAGGGALSSAQIATNSLGLASTSLTLGPTAGTNQVVAASGTLAGSPITFAAQGLAGVPSGPGPAAKLVMVSGNNQSGTVSQGLASPFVVSVTDANGNAVAGTSVSFTVTAGGGTLSASQVTTNGQGQAASTLTLGPNAGSNTVTAMAASLSGSPLTFSATGTAVAVPVPSPSAAVTWKLEPSTGGWPGYNGGLTLWYDTVSQQTILYGVVSGSSSAYSSDLFAYNSSSNTFTHIGGPGSLTNSCGVDQATWPGNRQSGWQMAMDSKRNVLWLAGGMCQGSGWGDTYVLKLNANPAQDTWQQLKPAHHPTDTGEAALVYDSDDDVLFWFGSDGGAQTHDNWVYCATDQNSTPGQLTSNQTGAGCSLPDDWTMVKVAGGVQPSGVAYPGMVYDTVTHKVIQYGGMTGGLIAQNQTWAYDVPSRTWTRKANATTAPPVYSGSGVAQPALVYDSQTKQLLYHQTSGTGAPADWQYSPTADTWTQLSSSGGGAATDQYLAYDAGNNVLIGFNRNAATGTAVVWQGSLGTGGTSSGPGPAAKLVMVSGNNQSGTVSQGLASPFVVSVTDANGNAVAGTSVSFTVTAGGGTLSASQVTTNGQGQAASTLTLGPNAGSNTVTAMAASLSGSPLTFSATGTAVAVPVPSPSAAVTWKLEPSTGGWPGYNGGLTLWYDTVSQQTILYGVVSGSSSAYSSDLFAYNSSSNTFTHIGGPGSLTNSCGVDQATWPGNRQSGWQMAMDSKRNVLWLAGGMCQGSGWGDTYVLKLNANPAQDTWQQLKPAHHPTDTGEAALVYDSDDDVLFWFGSDGGAQTHDNWVYCATDQNSTPGQLTSNQTGAGCSLPDDWTMVKVAGGVQPSGVAYPGMVYDTVTHKVIQYGGMTGGLIAQNQTWAYDVPSRTWTRKANATTAPPVYSGSGVAQPALVYDSQTKQLLYHQTSGTGAPADWQYSPTADTWTQLSSSGGGAATDQYLAYDAGNNVLIGFNRNAATGTAVVWQGSLGTGGTSSGPGPAAKLVMVSGNNQSGTVSQGLASPFVVSVTDANGNAVAGTSVSFTVTAGGGTLSASQVTTNGQGQAASTLTLGPNAGSNTVTATAASLSGSPLTFSATGTAVAVPSPGPAAVLSIVSGNNQTGTVGQLLASPLVVKVSDVNGNPVSATQVTFTVMSGGGTISSGQATTNSQGQAVTSWTLGATPGANTLSVTSGSLSGSPIAFSATGSPTASSAPGSSSVAWSVQPRTAGWPGYNGWLTLWFDPVSKQTILYGVQPGSSSIYSTDIYEYNSATNIFTHVGGTGSMTDSCPADTPSQPGNRHPDGQMSIDTKRNVLWIAGGICEGILRTDMYYLNLKADPTKDTWQQVTPAHFPIANDSSAMVYDSDDDVLFWFGSDTGSQAHDNWVYCPTLNTATPGVLTAKQQTAGCAAADDWNQIAPVGGVQPLGVAYPGMVYDTVTHKVIMYEGETGGGIAENQTWAYSVPNQTWTQKALSTVAPPLYTGNYVATPALAYNTTTNKVLYHQTSGSGAPADWQYDPVADTWSKLPSTGIGATTDQYLSYDSANNVLVGFNLDTSTGYPQVWVGALH